MSKSRGNVVNPDDIVRDYGADSLRLYEMFMGPLEVVKPWSTKSVSGVHRFLSRVFRLYTDAEQKRPLTKNPASQEVKKALHRTIKKVTEDTEGMRFNTAIAEMMSFVNELYKENEVPMEVAEPFVLLLAPYAPHLAEELWEMLGHKSTLAYEPWPSYDPALVARDTVTIAVQVNGKRRDEITVAIDAPDADILAAAKASEGAKAQLAGQTIVKELCVRKGGRPTIVNFVVK
jgi:leucyl-tRNA synthetase